MNSFAERWPMPCRWLLWMLLGALPWLAGCFGSSAPAGKTLVYGRGGDADSLDPVMTSSGEAVSVMVNLYDTLVTYELDSAALAPGLAESWQASDDQLTWTFRLREGVKFHDDTPCDAAAVAFNLRRLLDEGVAYGAHFTMIERIETPDERTVVLHLSRPSPVLLNNLAMFPASIASPQAIAARGEGFGRQPVGTGPFRFRSWTPRQRLVLEAFDDHWRGRPPLDQVIFLPIDESAIRVKALQRGEIHLADNLPPSELDALEKDPAIDVQSTPGQNVGYLSLQMERPPLDNPQVREAIWLAIDRPRLCQVVYAGRARPAKTLVPPTVAGHHAEQADRPFDPTRARQLLAEAAQEAGFLLPLKLQLFQMQQPRPYMPQPRQTALFLRDCLEPIGIECEIVTIDLRQYWERLSRGEHQLALAGWTTDNNDPDNFLYSLLDADNINDAGGNNLSRYNNPRFHELLRAAQQELDHERRMALYHQAQDVAFADIPIVPLVHSDVRVAVRREVTGYRLHPSTLPWLRGADLAERAP